MRGRGRSADARPVKPTGGLSIEISEQTRGRKHGPRSRLEAWRLEAAERRKGLAVRVLPALAGLRAGQAETSLDRLDGTESAWSGREALPAEEASPDRAFADVSFAGVVPAIWAIRADLVEHLAETRCSLGIAQQLDSAGQVHDLVGKIGAVALRATLQK